MVYVSMNNFAGCIEGDQRHCNSETYVMSSDLKSRKTNGSEPSLVGGVGVPALGTLTITGSNMHRGIEMPVAQPYFSSRSRMGCLLQCSCEGCSRGPASAFRTFWRWGDSACKCGSYKGRGADVVALPRLQSLL
jgi:hypothetical protein